MKKYTTADRLKQIMNERDLKQVDILNLVKPFCEKYNEKINKSHMSQWVSGINEPNQPKLYILAQALGVSEPWLMGYDVSSERTDMKKKAEQDADLLEMFEQLTDVEKQIVMDMMSSMIKRHNG